MPTERRLAAILAADVVGYSRLMGADELGTLRALKALRADLIDPAIGGYRGRIVKTTGDGLLVEFASAVDAVACAVTIQGDMRRRAERAIKGAPILLRIGVNIGDIIIDGEDIFGDGVNVAARLESICEPGGVAISRATRDQVRDKLDIPLTDLGEQNVKNIARPVRIFGIAPGAIANIRASTLPERSDPVEETRAAPAAKQQRSRAKAWRLRIILAIVALFVLQRQEPVRHAIRQIVAWVTAKPDASPADKRVEAPAARPQLAPLPPPIDVPAAPGTTPDSNAGSGANSPPTELHPPD
jgi:class 3 adenylate cyclase